MDKPVGIIGAGRLGKALTKQLKERGCAISGITCANFEETNATAQILGVTPFAENQALALASGVLFITVPDNLIVSVTRELLTYPLPENIIILHCSGAMSASALPEDIRISRGSFHPLQSFANELATLESIYVSIDGDATALSAARELCALLHARPLLILEEERALYHAAACMASNHLVTLLSLAEELFTRWASSPEEARTAFWPLILGTLNNYEKLGPQKALTGPIARGDNQTIARHLSVLPPVYEEAYKIFSLYTVRLAQQAHLLSEEKTSEIQKLLQ